MIFGAVGVKCEAKAGGGIKTDGDKSVIPLNIGQIIKTGHCEGFIPWQSQPIDLYKKLVIKLHSKKQ